MNFYELDPVFRVSKNGRIFEFFKTEGRCEIRFLFDGGRIKTVQGSYSNHSELVNLLRELVRRELATDEDILNFERHVMAFDKKGCRIKKGE